MKNIFVRITIMMLLVTAPWAEELMAQNTASPPPTLTVEVEGLTSEVRDGISKDLQRSGTMRLVYACVPAGIMVFEQETGAREQMRASLTPVLEHRIARQKIKIGTIDRAAAEERCAQARNR